MIYKIIITFLVIFIIWLIYFDHLTRKKRLNKYWVRSEYLAAKKWKILFPENSKTQIREFLEEVVDGFAFQSNKRLKFEPNDEILKIYHDIYGTENPSCDALELETVASNLEDKYSVNLENVFHDTMTLAELFKIINKNHNQSFQRTR